jgi:hypothetical protein
MARVETKFDNHKFGDAREHEKHDAITRNDCADDPIEIVTTELIAPSNTSGFW